MSVFSVWIWDAIRFGSVIETTDVGPIRFALVGLALILLMVFRPQGLLGNREEALIDER